MTNRQKPLFLTVGLSIVALAVWITVAPNKPMQPEATQATGIEPPSHRSTSELGHTQPLTPNLLSNKTSSQHVQPPKSNKPQNQPLQQWREHLSQSDDPEELLVAATLEPDTDQREQLLFDALRLDPYNPLINFMVAEHCLSAVNSTQCGPEIFDLLEMLDSNNGAVKDLKAIHAYRNGDIDSAAEMMEAASATKVTDAYEWQHMAALGESLDRLGVERDAQFFKQVHDYAIKRSGQRKAALMNICEQQRTSETWQQSCMKRGTVMMENELSMGGKYFGFGLAIAASDTPEEFQRQHIGALQAEAKALSNYADVLNNQVDIAVNDAQWGEYLQLFSNKGETAAMGYLAGLVK